MMYNSHPYIEAYVNLVESGELPACKEQHQLIKFVKNIKT